MARPLDYFPNNYQNALFGALGLTPGDEVAPAILASLQTFQQQWTGMVDDRDFCYDTDMIRAYSLYYMTMNMPKLWLMLDRCAPLLDKLLADQQTLRITELGCGPGTMLWAMAFYLQAQRPRWSGNLHLHGIDGQDGFLNTATQLATHFQLPDTSWEEADWQQRLSEKTDVLILSNTAHEQDTLDLAQLAESPARLIIWIEPGTHESFHRLLPWRDHLLAAGWHAHFPCPQAAHCPMAETTNWCHFHINRFVLPFVQRICGKAKRLNPRHHFTGFVFSRTPTAPAPTWRVMSTVRKANRSAIRYLCDGEHLPEVVLNRRAKSPLNQAFTEAQAGDMITYRPGAPGRRLWQTGKLFANDNVDIVAPRVTPCGEKPL